MPLLPHIWTLGAKFRQSVLPVRPPASQPWATTIEDPRVGEVRISGRLTDAATPAAELVIMVHGMAGNAGSHYLLPAAAVAREAGLASLRLNLRGSDCSGDDFYHAALTADLHAALASEPLARFERVYLLGFSLGGHVTLRLATEEVDPRVRSVAAVCTPLDLAASSRQIDSPSSWLYCRYLLHALARIYATVAARRAVPLPIAQAARIRKMRDWDERIVAPHHGFAGADDYYARASVGPRLADLRLPALLVNSELDPMVPAHTVRTVLTRPSPRLEVRWVAAGGHVAFPAGLDLGQGGEPGLVQQVLRWLRRF
jgi:predicted alpha/beta-fold hydrolase